MALPIKPSESDCCNSGCNPCILDAYEEQLRKYRASLQISRKPTAHYVSPTSYTIFKLADVKKHTRDCNVYTFEYVRRDKALCNAEENFLSFIYEPGQYLMLKASLYGNTFQKAYTPIYIENQAINKFTVLVKLYEGGRMSRYFQGLTVDTETLWRGPYGDFKVNYGYKNMLFIAQGTGIAPFYTICCDMLNNEECYTFLTLFFCCHVENVLLRDELYKLGEFWNFKYELFISSGSRNTFKGKYNEVVHFLRLDIEYIKEFLKGVKGNRKILLCGAESFCENIKNMLVQCGVSNGDITIF